MMADVNQAAESTPPAPPTKPCRFCQVPVPQPTRRGQVKDFCSDRHRAAFRDSQVQAGIREAQAAILETHAEINGTREHLIQLGDNLERLTARMMAATQLLERGLRHGRRKPKAERSQAEPSAELTRTLAHLTLPEELLDDVRKLQGLPPYDGPTNIVRSDGYFYRDIVARFGETAVQAAVTALEKK